MLKEAWTPSNTCFSGQNTAKVMDYDNHDLVTSILLSFPLLFSNPSALLNKTALLTVAWWKGSHGKELRVPMKTRLSLHVVNNPTNASVSGCGDRKLLERRLSVSVVSLASSLQLPQRPWGRGHTYSVSRSLNCGNYETENVTVFRH